MELPYSDCSMASFGDSINALFLYYGIFMVIIFISQSPLDVLLLL